MGPRDGVAEVVHENRRAVVGRELRGERRLQGRRAEGACAGAEVDGLPVQPIASAYLGVVRERRPTGARSYSLARSFARRLECTRV